jgi:hypothetical protein
MEARLMEVPRGTRVEVRPGVYGRVIDARGDKYTLMLDDRTFRILKRPDFVVRSTGEYSLEDRKLPLPGGATDKALSASASGALVLKAAGYGSKATGTAREAIAKRLTKMQAIYSEIVKLENCGVSPTDSRRIVLAAMTQDLHRECESVLEVSRMMGRRAAA